jgi:nitrogen-specific signal transduction histidine kinase
MACDPGAGEGKKDLLIDGSTIRERAVFKRSRMTVTIRDTGEIRIRDNSTGIPEYIRDKPFQPLVTTRPSGHGIGLGLSITYDIVTMAHSGTITIDSEVDAFTEFVVTLTDVRKCGSRGMTGRSAMPSLGAYGLQDARQRFGQPNTKS